jgi:glycosidase
LRVAARAWVSFTRRTDVLHPSKQNFKYQSNYNEKLQSNTMSESQSKNFVEWEDFEDMVSVMTRGNYKIIPDVVIAHARQDHRKSKFGHRHGI